jgi:hypothetical protein
MENPPVLFCFQPIYPAGEDGPRAAASVSWPQIDSQRDVRLGQATRKQ